MDTNNTNRNLINLREKRKLAKMGKKLDPEKIRLLAIQKLTFKEYIKKLADHFSVSQQTIYNAFAGLANAMLYEIKVYLKSID